jgi:hypothetical protein
LLAGAAAGAAIGTVRVLRHRRAGAGEENEPEENESEDDEPGSAEPEDRSDAGSPEEPSGLRGLLISVLSQTADALQKSPDTSDSADAQGSGEGTDEGEAEDDDEMDEEDDEEGERPSRGSSNEQSEPREADEEAGGKAERLREEPAARSEPAGADEGDPAEEADGHPGANGLTGIAKVAREQLAQLVGREPEAATRLTPTDGGWNLSFEVVDLERVPRSTDVMASYDVSLDHEGRLLDYARLRRYYRNRPEDAI